RRPPMTGSSGWCMACSSGRHASSRRTRRRRPHPSRPRPSRRRATGNSADDTMSQPSTRPLTQPRYAGFVTRAIACLLDAAVLAIILLLLAAAAQAIGGLMTLYGVLFSKPEQEVGPLRAAIIVLGIVAIIAYPIVFWVLAGQTPGKALMGLRVVRLDGGPM